MPFDQCLFFQFYRVPFPAHSCAGSPRWHALRTFRHVPPLPFLTSQPLTLQLPVAVGVRRLCTKSQPARGAVFQRLHALLRESPETEPRPALGGVTRSLRPRSLTDFRLSSQTVTAACVSYTAVTNRWICDNETREESHPRVIVEMILRHGSQQHVDSRSVCSDIKSVSGHFLWPKDYGPAGFLVKYLWPCKLLFLDT